MKLEDVFFIGGLVFIGYWLTKKQPIIIPSEPLEIKPLQPEPEEPKSITIDMGRPTKRQGFYEPFRKGYNSSMEATFSPQKVHVKSDF
jgi:hypothetical protein